MIANENSLNFAVVGTMLTLEGFDLIMPFPKIEADEFALLIAFHPPLSRNQGSAYGTGYIVVLGHYDLFIKDILKSCCHTPICSYSALEKYPVAYLLISYNLLYVVIGY